MQIKKFFPPVEKVAQETIAVLLATIAVAWLISRSPELKKLVKDNSIG
jgi:hypothetical protein